MTVLPTGRQRAAARLASAGPFDAAGLLLIAAVLGWLDGAVGLGSGALIAGVWLAVPRLYAVAVGHLLLLVVPLGDFPVLALCGLEAGFAAILIGSRATLSTQQRVAGLVLVTTALLGGLVWVFQQVTGTRWLALGVGGVVVAGAAYALHRYALLRAFTGGPT